MIECYKCKYSIIPKQNNLKLNILCINTKQIKGIVKSRFKCEHGELK